MALVSVSDLTTYIYCKRKLWLSRRVRIKSPKRDFNSKAKLHLLHSITNLVYSKTELHSVTDFMFEALHEIPGEIIDTEISLDRQKLFGRVDVLRKTKDGYIIQEEKSSDPPIGDSVWPSDLLQVDAYAFLAEACPKYSPVVGGIIIYNDLIPRKVRPNPERAKEILGSVTKLLESSVLPEAEGNIKKCFSCDYYPLCQVLPQKGRLTDSQIKGRFNAK